MAAYVRHNLDVLLGKLTVVDPTVRDLAASDLGDLLEADYLRGKTLRRVVNTLIDAAVGENDAVVRESLFNALSSAIAIPETKGAKWNVLLSSPAQLDDDCLEHSFVIVGFLKEPRYRSKVEPYLEDLKVRLRSAAADALALLESPEDKARRRVR
jgi:hypothetical protein